MASTLLFIIILAMIIFMFKLREDNVKFKKQIKWLKDRVDSFDGKNSDQEINVADEQSAPEAEPPFSQKPIAEPVVDNAEEQPQTAALEISKPSIFKVIEKELSTRWMIWLGGIAFAIGGAFLVKYSIDAGLLSPAIRVTMGTILGVAMAFAGEGIRQRREKIGFIKDAPDYVPGAISAAGLFTAFAAVYSAYALYDLISPLIAFAALAGLSFLSTGLAYFHGRFFAYLGMIGGLIIPALVSTGSGNAWVLFPYLLVIAGSALWISRKKAWVDVAGVTLLLSMLWTVLWIFTNWKIGDIIPVGVYLIILSGLNVTLLGGASPARSSDRTVHGLIPSHAVTIMSDAATLLSVVLLVSIVRLEHYTSIGFILLTIALIGQAYAVHKSPEYDMGGIFSVFGIIFLLGSWHVPDIFEIQQLLTDADRRAFIWSPIAPPGLQTFSIASLSLVGITSLAIFIRLPWLFRRALWATLGNLLPLMVLIIAYWRIKDLDTSIPFAGIAVIIALILTYGTKFIGDKSEGEAKAPIAAYAAGATMAVALALTMVLREAWLSFALALELVALGYIWQKTAVHGLRQLALLLAAVVLIRLFLNASIFEYHTGPMPAINWLFYGYGLTSGLFYLASRIFNDGAKNDRLISVLRAGWIIILISFISLELRVLFSDGGTLYSAPSELEIALQTVTWSLATVILMWREIKDQDKLLGKLRRFMTIVSLAGLILGGGLANNIFLSRVDVGGFIIFNLQFLQFLIPALLYAVKAYLARMAEKPRSLKIYSMVAFLAFWFWLSAEVRHAFHPSGGHGSPSDWEGYTYSLIWLMYSVILLVIGLQRRNETVRLAGLGVLSVVVLKVFLSDMSELEGLARALSFMGLGAALIGIGYLYQRLKVVDEKTSNA